MDEEPNWPKQKSSWLPFTKLYINFGWPDTDIGEVLIDKGAPRKNIDKSGYKSSQVRPAPYQSQQLLPKVNCPSCSKKIPANFSVCYYCQYTS